MWQTVGLCDRSFKGIARFAAVSSERQSGCCMLRMFSEENGLEITTHNDAFALDPQRVIFMMRRLKVEEYV